MCGPLEEGYTHPSSGQYVKLAPITLEQAGALVRHAIEPQTIMSDDIGHLAPWGISTDRYENRWSASKTSTRTQQTSCMSRYVCVTECAY
eukprot:SAG11_NODE_2993_length_2783_cov_1.642697_1_plen_90_part_00